MKLYHYNGEGKYIKTNDARESPKEPGVYLIPKNATKIKPPEEVLMGEKGGYWIGNSWSSTPIPGDIEVEPTKEELRAYHLGNIDTKTDALISTGWKYKEQSVRLTVFDQINFEGEKNLFLEMLADGMTEEVEAAFPREIKVATAEDGAPVMLAMGTLAEYKAFVIAGKAWIREQLDLGWQLKREVAKMNLNQLEKWEDPRTD
jgi:hypothetical protein